MPSCLSVRPGGFDVILQRTKALAAQAVLDCKPRDVLLDSKRQSGLLALLQDERTCSRCLGCALMVCVRSHNWVGVLFRNTRWLCLSAVFHTHRLCDARELRLEYGSNLVSPCTALADEAVRQVVRQ